MSKLIIANWKMNPSSESEAIRLAKASDAKGVVICPPSIFLNQIHSILKIADLGAQDVFWENPIPGGAFTGEVSISMLKKSGASHVILGHSERRRYLNETDEIINKKLLSALAFELKVILCIGEPISIKKEGILAAKNFVKKQLLKSLAGIENLKTQAKNLILTYEPVWAISAGLGTGHADTPENAAAMINYIKELLVTRYSLSVNKVIYGGSVTSANVARILEYKEIEGALVGSASLKAEEFKKIIKISSQIQ